MANGKLVKAGLQVAKKERCQVRDADLQIHGPFKEVQFFQESIHSARKDLFALKRLSAWANRLNRSS